MRVVRNRKKAKPVHYELISRTDDVGALMYALLDELICTHHHDLARARIALAWCTSWKPDVDGRVTLGKCKKASDLDREVAEFDFIIMLRRAFWLDERVTDAQRRALLDHELCHAALKYDERGEPVEDERGRLVYRIRKHDVEEFSAVIERNGVYKRDLEQFAAALNRATVTSRWTACDDCRDVTPGWKTVIDEHGVKREARCDCVIAYQERYREAVPA